MSSPATKKTAEAMLKLGECHVKLKEPMQARAVYARVVSTYPGTDAAGLAQRQLSTIGDVAGGGSR